MGEEGIELAVFRELRPGGVEHGQGALELAEEAQGRAEAAEGSSQIVLRQSERYGLLVVGQGLGSEVEDVAGP